MEERTTNQSNAPYYAVPVPEGRMRSQEQTRFISPEIKASQEFERRHTKPIQEKRPTATSVSNIAPKATSSSSSMKGATSANPFDDEDDIEYDDSKNPFADETSESFKPDVAKETSNSDMQTTNPFGEYDSNLNPFD